MRTSRPEVHPSIILLPWIKTLVSRGPAGLTARLTARLAPAAAYLRSINALLECFYYSCHLLYHFGKLANLIVGARRTETSRCFPFHMERIFPSQ